MLGCNAETSTRKETILISDIPKKTIVLSTPYGDDYDDDDDDDDEAYSTSQPESSWVTCRTPRRRKFQPLRISGYSAARAPRTHFLFGNPFGTRMLFQL